MAEATSAAPAPEKKPRSPRWVSEISNAFFGRRLPRWDIFMVALAAMDVLLLLVRREIPMPEAWALTVIYVDWILLGFFAVEFVVSLARSGEPARFARANWYDLVGLIPIPIAILRAFRLGRVIHVLVWGSRFPSEADREFGGAYAMQIFRRYEPVIVEELTDPLLIRLLGVLRETLAKGQYATAFGVGLDARRDRLRGTVQRAMGEKRLLGLLLAAPGVRETVEAVEDQLVDVIVATLTDPELDAVIKESMDDALRGLQERIAVKSEAAAAQA